jgi:hypothetical protein
MNVGTALDIHDLLSLRPFIPLNFPNEGIVID